MENSHNNMLFLSDDRAGLISQIYKEYYRPVLKYMGTRTNNHYLAQDLAQDVFVRLLDCAPMLRMETIKSFVFTIARNILIDFLRRNVRKPELSVNEIEESNMSSVDKTDSRVLYKEILLLEKLKFTTFPQQRKKVYCMNRCSNMNISEISKVLCISKRTVECHLFYGRKEMRDYMLRCL